ncbi:DUF262 domain-containing protein [Achromobacter seleniivolatilans]|uniref:DUF262 domain-containing protein n=1 Tax=Achromobacter seleniivolatilans TaxID=3047478 RepID=A0ABY9M4L0_9BURK|nr:DUF262 domain-containing protein [Achromobacter sp. R39]WMD21558.1 DUF262 domain-containing protein [Achromobacter sp. R39]
MNNVDEDNALVNFEDDQADDLDTSLAVDRFRDAVLYGTDWTVRTLLQQIEQGNIDLSPDFQRRDAWSLRNKSRFIESVALQLPIPQIVLAERKEQRGTYIVLDGKQRLLTLAQFAGDFPDDHPLWDESRKVASLRLSGLRVLTDLNGKTYNDFTSLPDLAQMRTQFDNHTIRSALIRNWPDEDYLYEVFIRLNTGSVRLSPQELRQAMKPGPFTAFLSIKSAESVTIQKILGLSAPDFRMRDVDLLLRLIAFSTRLSVYRGNLKQFLDETHEFYNANWGVEQKGMEGLLKRLEDGLIFLCAAFGNERHVGRRYKGDNFESPLNRAVLDVQIASALDENVRRAVEEGRLDLLGTFQKMSINDQEFAQAVAGTTKSITAIRTRYNSWRAALEGVIGQPVQMPELPNG